MSRSSLPIALIALVAALLARPAEAQLFGQIKDMAKRKAAEATARTAGRVLDASGKAVDSTLEKGTRTLDTVVTQTSRAVGSGLVATPAPASVDRLARQLAGGRVELPAVRFVAGSDKLDPSSVADVEMLAAALRATTGVFAIEVGLAPGPDAQLLAMRRAADLQARLVAAGVEPVRLFATGVASTPQQSAGHATEQIAISRLR